MIKILFFSLLILFMAGCERMDNSITSPDNSTQQKLSKQTQNNVVGRYIVVLKDNISKVPEIAADIAKQNAATIGYVYSHSIKGFSAQMLQSKADALRKDSRVKFIEKDRLITLSPIESNKKPSNPGGKPNSSDPGQVTPWGVTAVGGFQQYSGNNKVWIIDTGVDTGNKDLNIDFTDSRNFVPRGKSTYNDGNGHGTHVAGTIAAIDNNIDVVGVAAGATVVAVRVLDNSGSGYVSWVIAGVDYVANAASSGDVANMSLGGSQDVALDDAVLGASGNVKFAIAAGNDGAYAGNYSPADVNGPNVYTVSAYGKDNSGNYVWASWSNWGYNTPGALGYGVPGPVDYSCPGVNILSLKAGGGTTTMSGTSMATPHLAGLLLLEGNNVKSDGTITDSQNTAEPIAHY